MFKNKTKLTIAIVGIIIFIIPIIFLNYTLDSLYQFSKASARESMQETLLELAHKTQKNLEPVNYLQNEFQEFHKNLFPKLPDEILSVRLDEDYAHSLYDKKLFDQIASLTLEKYSPIAISVANPDLKQHYEYISPALKNQVLYFENDINIFIEALNLIETHFVAKIGNRISSRTNIQKDSSNFARYDFPSDEYDNAKALCYKYLSRYCYYLFRINKALYTDYFGKQLLYPILKYTISSQGIHGYYSILIPQSSIDPEEIIKSVLASNASNIKIELTERKNNTSLSGIEENENGFQYPLDFPTNTKNQIKAYKELKEIDKTELLNKQLLLSVNYPNDLLIQKNLCNIVKVISVILFLLYIVFAYRFIKAPRGLKITLTSKLILVLSLIIVIPLMGTLILSLIPSQNLSNIIDNHVSHELHNEISEINTLNEENNYREISYIYELKKRISEESDISFKIGYKWPILKEQNHKWFNLITELWYVSQDGILYRITDNGIIDQKDKEVATLFSKYANNLGLITNTGQESKGSEALALAFLENYVTSEKEEIAAGQESIVTPDAISFQSLNKSAFIFCKDASEKPYYLYYKRGDLNTVPYRYINEYVARKPLWATKRTKFANLELGITLHNRDSEINIQWPLEKDASKQINDLLYKTVFSLKDNGKTTIKNLGNSDQISEWHYKADNAFIITGIAHIPHDTIYSFYIYLIIPILIGYTILLLMVVTGFISIFVKEPMSIYKEAISNLERNEYGTTIKSFSSDEFNSITIAFNEMSEALRQKEQMKRYVSDRLIKSVENNTDEKAGVGKTERVTILSSDIRNFTGISESHTPAEIVEMLNSYFTKMQQAITEQGGIIDKYIGDAIQAVFYEDPKRESQILRACKAALKMRKSLGILNMERETSGLFTIDNGIGIDTDFAVTGTIGTANGRKDFSVNGNVVERAASIEAKTKATSSKILVSKSSEQEISDLIISKQFDEKTMELFDVK